MTTLKALSTEELQAELNRRNQPKWAMPQPVDKPDWTALRKLCVEYVGEVGRDDVDEDMRQYIFEAAVEAVYGRQVWGWINDKLR